MLSYLPRNRVNYKFKARDIYTQEEKEFSLMEIILSDEVREKLHEEMEYELIDEPV